MLRWFPRPVAVAICGESFLASEMRLRDREELLWFVAGIAGPIGRSFDPESPDYAKHLERAYDRTAEWPPPLGSQFAEDAIYGTDEGVALFLMLALRETPGMDAATARALAELIEDDELAAVEAVAWTEHEDPQAVVLRLIDRHLGIPEFTPYRPPSGRPITWNQAIGELISGGKSPGLAWATPDRIGDLTLSQWRLVRSGGEPDDDGDAMPADRDLADLVMARRSEFFGIAGEAVEPEDGLLAEPPAVDLPEDFGAWEDYRA